MAKSVLLRFRDVDASTQDLLICANQDQPNNFERVLRQKLICCSLSTYPLRGPQKRANNHGMARLNFIMNRSPTWARTDLTYS